MVSIWTLHHFDISIYANHVETTFPWQDTTRWKQHHFHFISMGRNNVISRWKPHGFHVLPQLWLKISLETTNFMVSLLFLSFPWFPYGHHVISNLDTLWFQMLTPYGFHMDTMWCSGNHMKTNTRNSTA